MESTGIEYPPKTKIGHKTQNVNVKHLRCQCIVSGLSCEPSPYIFDIGLYLFFSLKITGFKNLIRPIALPVYFMVLNFDYGIQLSIIGLHGSKCCLMLVTFYPSVVILRGGG